MDDITDEDVGRLREKARLLRTEVVRLADTAGNGHYGPSFSIAEILVALYYHHLRIRPDEPDWDDRDRFTLGKGHAAIGLYPVLADLGYFDRGLLDSFGHVGSPFGDHPNMHEVPGVDFSSGSIGHNLSVAVGMALSLRRRGSPARVVNLMGDGEQAEGQIWEAAGVAAHFGLGNLVGIVDRNGVGSDGDVDRVGRPDLLAGKWEAFGWEVWQLPDGHDLPAVVDVLGRALEPADRPRVVLADTVSGRGVSFMEGRWQWHLGTLGPADRERALAEIAGGTV